MLSDQAMYELTVYISKADWQITYIIHYETSGYNERLAILSQTMLQSKWEMYEKNNNFIRILEKWDGPPEEDSIKDSTAIYFTVFENSI